MVDSFDPICSGVILVIFSLIGWMVVGLVRCAGSESHGPGHSMSECGCFASGFGRSVAEVFVSNRLRLALPVVVVICERPLFGARYRTAPPGHYGILQQ